MGLEDLRRWHWAGIGVLVGLAFGSIRTFYGPDSDGNVVYRLNSQRDFELGLTRPPNTVNKISDIVVHPKDDKGRVWITFSRIRMTNERMDPNDPNSPRKGLADHVGFDVAEPYKPVAIQPSATKTDLTVRDYLADVQKQFPDAHIKHRYAWEEVPRNTMLLCAAGGLVLIGGVWPSIVGLLTGGGIWGPKPRPKAERDMSMYGAGSTAAVAAGAAGMSAEDSAKLAEMEDAMLANLGGFGAGGRSRDSDSVDEDAPIKPLTGGPLEGGADPRQADEADKEYKGDFYPVARPAGKKDDE